MANKSIRVLANANNKQLRTVNIITSTVNKRHKEHTQQSTDSRQWANVQAAAAPTVGLPSVYIPSYSGPA